MWSLEMQWFSPEAAISLAEKLHASGWLVGEPDSLFPCQSSFEHSPELGWRPFLSRMGEVPEPSGEPPVIVARTAKAPAIVKTESGDVSEDPKGVQVSIKDCFYVGSGEARGDSQGTEEEEGIGASLARGVDATFGQGAEPRDGPTRGAN